MEEEDEIRSHASPTSSDSLDPSSSPPPGRVMVTVASTETDASSRRYPSRPQVFFVSNSEIENESILECSTMNEAKDKRSTNVITALPAWLKLYKKENQPKDTDSDNSINKRPSDKTFELSSQSPSSSSSKTYAHEELNLRLSVPKHDNELTT